MTTILQNVIETTRAKLLHWKREEGAQCAFTAADERGARYRLEKMDDNCRMFEFWESNCKFSVDSNAGQMELDLLNTLQETIVSSYPFLVKPVNLSVSLQKIKERLSAGKYYTEIFVKQGDRVTECR